MNLQAASSLKANTVTKIEDLESCRNQWQNQTIGFVPTMGALHEGHLALVREARKTCDRVVVSIFVNPKQFGPNEDLVTYPRMIDADLDLLAAENVDLVFIPDEKSVYPDGFQTKISVVNLDTILTGQFRPQFFSGIATVVTRLFMLVRPTHAYFGKKDYQQWQMICQLVADLHIPVDVIGVPIVRESDGLALSSRNMYLNEQDRAKAPALYETLLAGADKARAGMSAKDLEDWGRETLQAAGFESVDYFAARLAEDITTNYTCAANQSGRLIAATWLGTTRLVDNVEI